MSEDLLKAATRALRDETADGDESANDGRFTRARVMASLHQGRVKRRTRLAFILPIAAVLAAGTAWGAATGKLPAVFHAIGELVSFKAGKSQDDATPASGKAKQGVAATTKAAPAAPTPEAPPPADAIEPPSAPATPEAPLAPAPLAQAPGTAAVANGAAGSSRASGSAVPATPAAVAPSSSAAFHDADGDLYRLAHEAHFVSHDYGRALAAWDAYLKEAPRGRFATEARYNRAICLLRLGRDAEARQALEPFASGKMGYRQSEASQLLEELSR
jgi:TolA-binding protein